MGWLTQNWVWIVVAIGLIWMMRRGGMPGCGMGHAGHGGGSSPSESGTPPAEKPAKPTDPVTGKEVDAQHAITSYYQGQVYYFEDAATRQRFEASPEKYARKAAPAGDGGQRAHRHHGC